MPEEIGQVLNNLEAVETKKFGDLELFSGEWVLNDKLKIYLTIAWSGWGKVSAARATTRLISTTFKNLPIEILLFTGVAGAIDKKLKQWDIVISESVMQHDMDARPIFDKFVIPAINNKKIFANKFIVDKVFNSLTKKLQHENLNIFGSLYKGLIATGDMFISDRKKINQLSKEILDLLAVEMEGASFAQVAYQEKVDWIVLRVISDGSNEDAHDQFNEFLEKYKFKSSELIRYFISSLVDN